MKAPLIFMRTLLFTLTLVATSVVFAQQPSGGENAQMPLGTISGSVNDESGEQSLEFATVALYKVQDSSLVGGGITDVQGNFSVQAKPGKYYLKIGFIGYGEKYISDINIGRDNMNVALGSVKLAATDLQLDEVTVQAERTQMELQLDKKVYNIGQDLSNLGGSASDLLGNLPSVAVDVDGNVSLRGSENVQILIDGKPSNLVGLSGSGGLQQLQGNLVERVEIITNPSARYDAAGGAGIINIILKKEKAKGFNGSFQVQTGYPANHGATVNINYRTGWINWFVNYGFNYRENPGQGFNNMNFYNSNSSHFIDQTNNRLRTGISQNIRFGSDIYLNENNILTLSASYRNSDNDNETKVNYDHFDPDRVSTGNRFRTDNEKEDDLNWQYALNYSRDFARKGQKLTFDVQYQDNSELELSMYDDDKNVTNEDLISMIQRSSNDNGETQTLIQGDYVHPFGKFAQIETGFRYTYRNIYNDYIVESDSSKTGNFEEVTYLTNDFNFDEKILASYFLFSNQLNEFSYQVGTRIEHTDLSTFLEQGNLRNNQDYLSLFPSANVSYKLTDEKSIQVSYSRRISRPNFRSLNPFNSLSDILVINAGNPNLQPQFTDSYELGILNNQPNSSVYYGIYHRHTDGAVQRITEGIDGINYRTPQNLAVENALGIEINVTRDFGKKFRTSGNFNFYNSKISGKGYSAEATTFNARWGNIYNNPKLFDAQLNVWYRAPQNNAQGRQFGMASVDVGLSKDVFNKNGTVSMNVQDLFNTRKYRGETFTDTFSSISEFQWRRGPTLTLSFTYRLNQSKRQQRRGQGEPDRGNDGFEEGFSPGS